METLKLVTTEGEEIIWYQNQTIILQNFFRENLLAIKMKKTQITMNEPAYLQLSILDLSKTVMYEFGMIT